MACKQLTGSCQVLCPLLLKRLPLHLAIHLLLHLVKPLRLTLAVVVQLHLSHCLIPTVQPVIVLRSLLRLIMRWWWMRRGGRGAIPPRGDRILGEGKPRPYIFVTMVIRGYVGARLALAR